MTIKTLAFSGLAAAAFLAAAVPASAQTPGAVDAADTAAAASYVRLSQTMLARHRPAAARDDMERAETVLLNKAEYDGTARINPGTGMVLTGQIERLAQARSALQAGRTAQAATDLAKA